MQCHNLPSHIVGGFISQFRMGLGGVVSSSESESKSESDVDVLLDREWLSQGTMGRLRIIMSPSGAWYRVAGVAVAGGVHMVLIGAIQYSAY